MDPKLLRMYSNILNEQDFATQYATRNVNSPGFFNTIGKFFSGGEPAPGTAAAVRGGRGGTGPVTAPQAAKPTALPGDPNAPAYTKDPGQTKKVGTGASGFPTQKSPQGGRSTPAAPAIDPRVAAARKADAARQAAAPAPGTTQDPSSGQGNRAFLPGAAGGAKPETPAAQTTPDQMRTTSAVGASNIGFTGPEPAATAAAPAPAPVTGQSSYTSPTGVALGAEKPEEPGTGASSYTSTAGAAMGATGQAARPTTTGPAVTSSSGEPVKTGSGGTLTSRDFNQPQFNTFGQRINEYGQDLEEEVEESIEEQLEEAFNEMLRLSGLKLNEKAPPGAKAERMVKHIKKGYAKDGKLSDKEKSIAFATAWKAKKAGKLDEGFRPLMDEEGHTLEHIVNRFKHEAKTFLNTGEMSDKLYDALYDYYLDRGEMPYGIAKAREGDPYTWVAARFEADIDGTVDVKMPLGEVGGDNALNELARLAGLSEGRVDECGDMGMDTEDRLNVSTNMSSDGTKSVNISAQGEKAEELLSMLKLAGMGGSNRPAMVMIDRDEEMMDEGILGDRSYNRVMPIVKRIASEVSDYDRDEFGEEMWSLLDQKYGSKFAQAVLQDDLDFYWNEYTDLTGQGLDEDRPIEYANTPEEEYQTVASITRQGNDLNREKKQFANMPKAGDNPMATDYMLDEELSALLDSVLVKEADPQRPKGDTGVADIYTADKGIPPPSPDEGPIGKSKMPVAPPTSPTPKPSTQSALGSALQSRGAGQAAPSQAAKMQAAPAAPAAPKPSTQSALGAALGSGGLPNQAAAPTPKPSTQSAFNMRTRGAMQQAAPSPGIKR